MADFAHFFSVYTTWAAIPCLAIIGIVFSIKQNTKESLIFATGIVLVAIGSLMQLLSPFQRMTMDQVGKILSSNGPPLSWYSGSIITSLGLIITVVGFALVTWKTKKVT